MDNCKYAFVHILSTGAILTTLLFGFWCRSFTFEAKTYELSLGGQTISIEADDLHFSPWFTQKTDVSSVIVSGSGSDATITVNTVDSCVEWGTDEDTKWLFVKYVTIITPALGGIMGLMMCAAPCLGDVISKAWHCMALTFIVVLTTLQGLAFLIYNSNACTENPVLSAVNAEITAFAKTTGFNVSTISNGALWETECSWDQGSTCNVVSTVFWCLTGVAMLVLGAPSATDGENDNDEVIDDALEDGEKGDDEKQEQPLAAEGPDADGDNRQGEGDDNFDIGDSGDIEVK